MTAVTHGRRFDTPAGVLWATTSGERIVRVCFVESGTTELTNEEMEPVVLTAIDAWLRAYLGGRRKGVVDPSPFGLPPGTVFQRLVWAAVQRIPYGETMGYSDVARAIGRPESVRAVAGAVARNPWLLLVPCHRVVGVRGSLTGYSGGIERKAALLRIEQRG